MRNRNFLVRNCIFSDQVISECQVGQQMIHILEAELRVNAGKDPVDDSIEDEAG